MKPRFSLTFTGLLLCSAALPAAASAPMTEFQRFTSYPFMDRSYREAKKDNWAEVERLTRHVLGRVPNNDEARALLVEALAHQRRYKEAEALAEQLGGSPEYANALLELRLTWIEQDPPPASQVEQWLAASDGTHRVRLWQAYSLSLAKFGGAAKALDWLNQLPPGSDGQVLRLARANFAEQLRNWKETSEQLQPLADKGQLPAEDWQRLANAYIQQVDEKGLNALLPSAPSAEAANQARLAMANRAIAVGHNQAAQRWLQSLPPDQLNQPEQRQQLWQLAREGDDAALVRRLSNDLQRPCLETVDWLSHQDPDLAREQFKGCTASSDPRAYAVLKQRLYGDPPQSPQPRTASEWEKRYRQTGDLAALEQTTFLLTEQGHSEHARQLLEQAYDRRQGRLTPSLLQRLGNLYARNDGPLDSRRMLGLIPGSTPIPAPSCSAAWPRPASATPYAKPYQPPQASRASTAPWAAAPCPTSRVRRWSTTRPPSAWAPLATACRWPMRLRPLATPKPLCPSGAACPTAPGPTTPASLPPVAR